MFEFKFWMQPSLQAFEVKCGGFGDFCCSQLNSLAVSQLHLLSFPVLYQAKITLWWSTTCQESLFRAAGRKCWD